jgi:hypothetical protein
MRWKVAEARTVILAMCLLAGFVNHVGSRAPSGECQLHHIPLTSLSVPVEYGLLRDPSKAYMAASKAKFPHAVLTASGGCVAGSEVTRAVWACPRCNEAATEWLKKHPKDGSIGWANSSMTTNDKRTPH